MVLIASAWCIPLTSQTYRWQLENALWHGPPNISCKRLDSKSFNIASPTHSTLPLRCEQPQTICKWMTIAGSNKTLFTKTQLRFLCGETQLWSSAWFKPSPHRSPESPSITTGKEHMTMNRVVLRPQKRLVLLLLAWHFTTRVTPWGESTDSGSY